MESKYLVVYIRQNKFENYIAWSKSKENAITNCKHSCMVDAIINVINLSE